MAHVVSEVAGARGFRAGIRNNPRFSQPAEAPTEKRVSMPLRSGEIAAFSTPVRAVFSLKLLESRQPSGIHATG
jgi:hypothetical protein